jgi:periplasmic protein TonB
VLVLAGIIVPLVPVPKEIYRPRVVATTHLTRMIPAPLPVLALKKPEVKPPKPRLPAAPQAEAKPAAKPAATPAPKAVAPAPITAEQKAAEARQRANNSGVLQFQDQLQAMRELVKAAPVQTQLSTGGDKAEAVVRNVLGRSRAAAPASAAAQLGGAVGVVALPGQAVSEVVPAQALAEANNQYTGGMGASREMGRSDAEIRRVMDSNKGAIFSIYNRALRTQPLLRGKLTIQLVIGADGGIASATIVASDLTDADLQARLLSRIRLINFGDAAVAATTLNYSFEFLPG